MDKQYFIHYGYELTNCKSIGTGSMIVLFKKSIRNANDYEKLLERVTERLQEWEPLLRGRINVVIKNIIPLPIK